MFRLSIENAFKESMLLSQNEANYQIVSISGLNPPNVQLNRSPITSFDGTKYNSSRIEERNLVITLRINGDVEKNRLALYNLFKLKNECTVFYKNESRDVYINGYVESIECDYFSMSEQMQISIVCPSPYFKDIEYVTKDISKILRRFHFPFSINIDNPISFSDIDIERVTDVVNLGDVESGVIITINFIGDVHSMKIINVGNGETFTSNYDFVAGDTLKINTYKGEKSVKLNHNGVESNLFSSVTRDSVFFTLIQGSNYFSFLADNGEHDSNVDIMYTYTKLYVGV